MTCGIGLAPAEEPGAVLDRTSFDARGTNSAILTVTRYGRYSLRAKSPIGTSIQVVDRMMGPGESDGETGARDGRVDTFFDGGKFKVIARSSKDGRGALTMSVRGFTEQHAGMLPPLVEKRIEQGTLDDEQQVSYWIDVRERQPFYAEAMGRNLSDLRLWRDGSWLLDAVPGFETRETESGRPMNYAALVADLTPGSYVLTAYGGPAKAWAKGSDEHPFWLRSGIPSTASTSRIQASLSPFGIDRYVVPSPADTFLVRLQEKHNFQLDALSFEPGDGFGIAEASAAISKKSQDPECTVQRSSNKRQTLVTLTGTPGEPYVLQTLQKDYERTFTREGTFWISTIHSGDPDDNIDASAILVATSNTGDHTRPVATDVIHLSRSASWARRFNLLAEETMFISVEETGDYELHSSGTRALFRIEPFFADGAPDGYKSPDFQPVNAQFHLDPGYYVLTVRPHRKGIVAGVLQMHGAPAPVAPDSLLANGAPARRPCTQFGAVQLDSRLSYTLFVSHQEGVSHGLILRPCPLTLDDALPAIVDPGAELSLTISAPEAARLSVMTQGVKPAVLVDGVACDDGCDLTAGSHAITLRGSGERPAQVSIVATPLRLLPDLKPTAAPSAPALEMPAFQALREGAPQFADYGRGESRTFLLNVASPALYRIETTGLLETACVVRTRTQTKLFSAQANGIGRNALVQAFLKDGEYQVTVRTIGRSAGHAGLQLTKTTLMEGGPLTIGKDAKAQVPADSAAAYSFRISSGGKYHLNTAGLGKKFRCRIEDRDGWPLRDPSAEADATLELGAGDYRYLSLPIDVESLRVTRLDEVKEQAAIEGKGPHTLALDSPLSATWRETAERARDLFDIKIPADLDATIHFGSDEMQAFIKRKETGEYAVVDTVSPGKDWSGPLAAGDYRIEAECSHLNDYVAYSIEVDSEQLVAGTRKKIDVPGDVDVSVGRTGVVELSSEGAIDVRAVLKSDGETLDSNDDSYNDWNFRIARGLQPCRYRLHVDPVGRADGSTEVVMNMPEEVQRDELRLPVDRKLDLEGRINVLPIASGAQLICLRVSSGSFTGAVLQEQGGGKVLWRQVARSCEATISLDATMRYELRVWSADHLAEIVRLQAMEAHAETIDATRPSVSSSLTPSSVNGAYACFARVHTVSPGTFRIGPFARLSVAVGSRGPLEKIDSSLVALPAGDLIIEIDGDSAQRVKLQISRFTLPRNGLTSATARLRETQWMDVATDSTGMTLLQASSLYGRPACAFPASGENPYLSYTYDLGERTCLAVALPGGSSAQAAIWNASLDVPATSEVQLRQWAFPKAGPSESASGTIEGRLDAGMQRQWSLPAGLKQIALNLDSGLVAVAWGGPVEETRVAFAGALPAHRTMTTSTTTLSLFNVTQETRAFECRVLSAALPSTPARLAPARCFERRFERPGEMVLRIETALPNGAVLRAEGNGIVESSWIDETGVEQRRSPIQAGGHSGRLVIAHASGDVKAWVELPGAGGLSRWGSVEETPASPLPAYSITSINGRVAWYSVSIKTPCVAHLSTTRPAVLGIRRGAGDSASDPFLRVVEGDSLDYFLDSGNYVVGIRAFGEESLSGSLSFSTDAVTPFAKPAGPETFIGGGESKTFSFTVAQKGRVGIGLRTDGELLGCQLLARDERLIGSGIQQFVELDPGTYLLRVALAPDQAPLRFAPVVVGLEPPGSGPPDDYLQKFFEEIGMKQGGF